MACMQVVVAAAHGQIFDVHVIMGTPTPHLLLWAMTIFARVSEHPVIGMSIGNASIPMLLSGMARFVRVVAVAVSSTILRGSPRT